MRSSSTIKDGYRNANIFITGGTGYIGKMLIEKLIRSCSDLNHIYVLIRSKRGRSVEERFKTIFTSPLFDTIRQSNPTFIESISWICGDLLLPKLGLSDNDYSYLLHKANIHFVFHCGATIRFDERLSNACRINVGAVYDLVMMIHEMPHLKGFVHVSTAYSNCTRFEIEEKFYKTKYDWRQLLELSKRMDPSNLDVITNEILGPYPNTYSFTKAMGEAVIRDCSNVPTTIIRPSIVTGTVREPLRGFTDTIFGITGLCIGSGLGILRVLYLDGTKRFDMVPSDLIINMILAAGWNLTQSTTSVLPQPIIYNYVSGPRNPITLSHFHQLCFKYNNLVPTKMIVWYPFGLYTKNWYLFQVLNLLLHTLPGHIMDLVASLCQKEQRMVKIYKKIDKMTNSLSYFMLNEWHFNDANVRELFDRLNPIDRDLFNFDITTFDWDEYLRNYVYGCRVYAFKEPISTLELGRRKIFQMKILHYGFCVFLLAAVLVTLWTLICFVL